MGDSLQPACCQPIKFQTKRTKASESSFVCLKAPLLTKLKFACGNDIPTLQSRAIPLSSRPSPLRGSGLDTAVWPSSLLRNVYSRMSRGGCYGMTNADWLISPPAAQILPGLLRERVRMAKIKETERVRIPSLPAFFCKSRDA